MGGAASSARWTLSPGHAAWVTENLLAGVAQAKLVTTLVEGGVPRRLARTEVAAIASSGAFRIARCMALRLERIETVMAMRRTLAVLRPAAISERRTPPSRREFLEHYYAAQSPLVLRGLCATWRATRRWSPAYFKRRFGDVLVDVCVGRAADP